MINEINMEQAPVNQRIKILIEQMGLSARAFSEAINESPTNTHNYIGKRNSMPGADYLEKIISHFENVNPIWLFTGQGEPFLTPYPSMNANNKTEVKKTKGDVQANTGKTVNNIHLDDCQRDLAAARAEAAAAQNEIKLLREQMALQATVIAAKDETITLLRASYNRPN